MTPKRNLVFASLMGVICACAAAHGPTVTPTVTTFIRNTTGTMGSSNDSCIDEIVSLYEADVQRVRHNGSDVYINATGIPSYPVGPFPDGNPSMATDANWIFRIPKSPTEETGPKTTTPLGPIGVYVNGVPIYNSRDGMSFNNQGNWNQNAVTNEGGVLPGSTNGFDANVGHSNPVMGGATVGPCTNGTTFTEGEYHHHQRPISLMTQLSDDGSAHSPIVGWAFDGYPVYGPYGYDNSNGTGSVRRMESGYSLIDGFRPDPMTDPNSPGGMYDGTYIEDYEFSKGFDLDVYNGRFAVTPEYPDGIYHYHATINVDGELGGNGAGDSTGAAYPYIVGPQYFGVAAQDNFITGLVEGDVPGDVVDYPNVVVVTPSSFMVSQGDFVSGGLPELATSDNVDLTLRRRNADLQSRTEFEVKSVSPTATPATFEFTLEGSVFARGNVVQTIEMFDYAAAAWELVDTTDARRAPAPDSVVTVAATGDLSRFVEAGTMSIEARIRYKSDRNRQKFASNTDQAVWTIGQ